ncbi:hypothetical protein B5X24_HaOG205646 [Helicoverpa armigera]|uniref:Uncharacterized protein n=1 Tax=Helicoverpa armigera TaxID=29058 RepID=A0A2W1BSP8_HELAM|nr:hypothetical protein B5X24_HaOG205646 [Helicoverpa armigera]
MFSRVRDSSGRPAHGQEWTRVATPQDGRVTQQWRGVGDVGANMSYNSHQHSGHNSLTSLTKNTETLRVQLEQDGRKYSAEGHNNTTNVSTTEQIT